MVEWKGEINRQNSGRKAALLDQLQDLEVPNFFTITKEETKRIVRDTRNPEELKNKQIPQDIAEEIEKAYKEVGISSEVRKSSGRAKNLVGGQRNNQKVSIRVSNSKKGSTEAKLNVGKSSLEKAIKEVIASFYEEEQKENYPSIIIQKMIEPERTGSIINNYNKQYQLFESVEGLGIALEEGSTKPDFYLIKNRQIEEKNIAKNQTKTTLHPLNGDHRSKQIKKTEEPYNESEVLKMAKKSASQDVSLKFAYKRGTFYVTDAFQNTTENLYRQKEPSLDLIKASEGEITGTIGREIKTSQKPLPPKEYSKILFSRNGAYTSDNSQKARQEDKTIVISHREDLSQGQHIGEETTSQNQDAAKTNSVRVSNSEVVTATTVLPIDQGKPAINTQPPFTEGYSITSLNETKGTTIKRENYLKSYQEIFENNKEENREPVILDARKMEKEGLLSALEYINGEPKILLLSKPDSKIIEAAIRQKYSVIGAKPSIVEEIEREVARQEKKIILENAIDS